MSAFGSLLGVVPEAVRILASLTTLPWSGRVPHLTRFVMYESLREALRDTPEATAIEPVRVLSISGSEELLHQVGLSNADITAADHPEHDMLDLHRFDDETFDVVVSDQVLEHIEGNPQRAIDEGFRVLKPGGLAIHTTCFMNPVHYAPNDLWRFTPEALELLCSSRGQVVHRGGWGNIVALLLIHLDLRFVPVPPKWHPLGVVGRLNQPTWPISTWVVARKAE